MTYPDTPPTGVWSISLSEAVGIAERNGNDPTHCRTLFERWLDRGDTVCVYENQDLGHRSVGDKLFVSYGSPAAQIERTQFPSGPPTTLPDIGGTIGWRYQLDAVVDPAQEGHRA